MENLTLMGSKILDVLSNIINFGNTYIGTYLLIVLLLIAGFYLIQSLSNLE